MYALNVCEKKKACRVDENKEAGMSDETCEAAHDAVNSAILQYLSRLITPWTPFFCSATLYALPYQENRQ